MRRVSRNQGGGHEERPEPTAGRSTAGDARYSVLDPEQWSGPARHAGLVEAAGTTALADWHVLTIVEGAIDERRTMMRFCSTGRLQALLSPCGETPIVPLSACKGAFIMRHLRHTGRCALIRAAFKP